MASYEPRNGTTNYDTLGTDGTSRLIGAETITVLMYDPAGDVLLAQGLTVPTDATSGYAKGCLFIDTDVATGTTGLNCNKGTRTSCQFTAVTQA